MSEVNVIVGRFQPFTKGHLSLIDAIKNKSLELRVYIVDSNKSERNPFTLESRISLIKRNIGNKVLNLTITSIKSAWFINDLKAIYGEKKLKINLYCGSDREENYKKFSKYLPSNMELSVISIERNHISATLVRRIILNNTPANDLEEYIDVNFIKGLSLA